MEDIKTGVDAHWIADQRMAVQALLQQATETTVEAMTEKASEIADAMAAARASRGGVRDPSDPREIMATIQEYMPAVMALLETFKKRFSD